MDSSQSASEESLVAVVASEDVNEENQNGGGFPYATLSCRPNSHPFQERTLVLDAALKVGRSVARARPAANNAIFDCKVMTRRPVGYCSYDAPCTRLL